MARVPAASLLPPIGWPLLPLPDENGALDWPGLAASVAAQLRKLLATRPGELLGHRDYGAGLQRFLHEPNTLATRARIREAIEQAIARHEPRIMLDAVDVFDETDRAIGELGQVRIEVRYRLRRDGTPGELSAALVLGAS
jgi:phage baseplate assembly protein W